MFALRRADGFRMELHAFDPQGPMSKAHDLVLFRTRADFQAVRHRVPLDQQRMIAHRVERARDGFKDRLAVMQHRRGFTVHEARGTYDTPTERFPDTLMAQADAENRQLR